MIRRCVVTMLGLPLLLSGFANFPAAAQTEPPRSPRAAAERAVKFLAREVPQWKVANKCYSCHNNGDAARALFQARKQGLEFDRDALANTVAWLKQPENWRHNGGEGEFSDKRLAAIQFGASLLAARSTGTLDDRAALQRAAALVAAEQEDDGSWQVDAPGTVGSPATYGSGLATAAALRLLVAADQEKFADAIVRAGRWLRQHEAKNMPDAAGVLLALADAPDDAARAQRERCLSLLRKGQRDSGGWGPYSVSRTEPFDTAVAVLALAASADFAGRSEMIERGRRYLIEMQLDDGSWPETTRPSGDISYAQRLSTTGWATLALLADSKPSR